MTRKLYIGADVSAATIDVAGQCDTQRQVVGQFANSSEGFAEMMTQLASVLAQPATEIYLILEPTGGYELALVAFGHSQGWQVCLPNPKQVRDWAKGDGRRAKTDGQDAQTLAAFGAAKQPKPQADLAPEVQELADLLRRQEDLEQLLRSERNRLGSYQTHPQPSQRVLDSLQRTISAVQAELDDLNQQIEAIVTSQPTLKADRQRLRTVPGIGAKNVLPILVHLYRWQARAGQSADAKGLVAFTGVDPQPFQSGRSVRKRSTISRQGDHRIRQLLYMGALGGLRRKGHNPLRNFYSGLVRRGKAKVLALVAASRKILVWAWAVFTQRVDFDPTRFPVIEPTPA
jgi:transposase